jgi:plasmid replication initiation protein
MTIAPARKPLRDYHVTMSNRLVLAAQGLSLTEKRLVAAAVSQIDSKRSPETLAVRVRAQDFADAYGLDQSNAYAHLRDAEETLSNRYIRWTEPGPRGKLREVKMRWVYRVTYAKGEGWIELAFSPELRPHLTLLREKFTSYQLSQAGALRSVYSWRLMELFFSKTDGKKERPEGWLALSIEEFEAAMEAPVSCRGNYKDLKRRVLLPAVDELRQKNGLDIDVTTKTTGRKVTGLRFDFGPSAQLSLIE